MPVRKFAQKRTLHNDMLGIRITQPAPTSSTLPDIDAGEVLVQYALCAAV
jgi:hypothetical protein